MFKTVTHGSRQEWLTWRHTGIGSSDAPIIQGVSRYKTREELLTSKLLPPREEASSYILDRGNQVEIAVRAYYSALIGVELLPVNCINNEREWQLASLDGANLDKKIAIEIKLLTRFDPRKGKPRNTRAAGYIKFLEAKGGKIPDEYFPQIQHQLAVTGFDEIVFLGFDETIGSLEVNSGNLAIVSVPRNKEYVESLTLNETEFWKLVEESRSI